MKIITHKRGRKMDGDSFDEARFERELQQLLKRVEVLESGNSKNYVHAKSFTSGTESNLNKNAGEKYGIKNAIVPSLAMVFFTTMILMTVYEAVKQALHPQITIWQSHTITIIFASIIAPIGAYFAFRKIELLRQQATEEVIQKRKAEKELHLANEKLEEKVNERTIKLSEANERLLNEVKNRKQAEEEIRKYAEELLSKKDQLEEKTKALMNLNNQLEISEMKLKELNVSKDKFFSILAHDLRSPFTSLMGLSEFMEKELDKLDNDELKLFTAGISKSAKGIYNLLENLLEWSRVQTGRIKYEPAEHKVIEIVDDVINLNNFNILKKKLRIEKIIEEGVMIYADRKMIETVLRNLLSNAIKFTNPKGSVKITGESENDETIISVNDTGVGIEENNIGKLFKIDEQLSTTGTDNEKGTGLGLILCKEFVESNHGTIGVKSEIGKGTTFYFKLPSCKEKVFKENLN